MMLNEREKKHVKKPDVYDPDLDPASYSKFDWDRAFGVMGGYSNEFHCELKRIGTDGIRKRLADEYGANEKGVMDYYPPKKN